MDKLLDKIRWFVGGIVYEASEPNNATKKCSCRGCEGNSLDTPNLCQALGNCRSEYRDDNRNIIWVIKSLKS